MGRHDPPPEDEGATPGATEPITLTDPDGAVTLVAPWSTWTREQMRAPGGEPALVTRLEQGQLWFSAGRRRSPWRHEVHIGPVVVSTPVGRFHVTAEPDGGATVDCLAGRTRVKAGLQEPVILEAEQTAAVASDGDTLVVLDNRTGRGGGEPVEAGAAAVAAAVRADAGLAGPDAPADAAPEPAPAEPVVVPVAAAPARRRTSRAPELVAVAALLAVLVAAVVVFSRSTDPAQEVVSPARATSTTEAATTTAAPTTTTTEAPTTTAAPPTTPPAVTNPASATGRLAACRRADGGVVATIDVSMRSGGPGQFKVGVGLVDRSGQVFATGEAQTEMLEQGASAPVDVLVSVPGAVQGACQLLGVEAA